MSSAVRSTALRAGGACVRCRKGKTKCVYDNGRAPCKNCAKGMHECYLPSESMSHGGHGVSPARVQHRVRDSLPSERIVSGVAGDRQGPPASAVSRHVSSTNDKYVPFLPSPARSFAAALRFFFFFFLELFTPAAFSFPSPPPHFFLRGGWPGGGQGGFFVPFPGGARCRRSEGYHGCCPPASGCSPPRLTTPLGAPKMAPLALPLGAPPKPQAPFLSPPGLRFPTRPRLISPAPCASSRRSPESLGVLPLIKRRTTRSSLRLHLLSPPEVADKCRGVGRACRVTGPSCLAFLLLVSGAPALFGGRRVGGDAADRGGRQWMHACMHAAHYLPFGKNHGRVETRGGAKASHSGRPS